MSIRDTFFENKAVGALWDVAVSIKRGNPLPLDANSVFDSYASLETYASGVLAYPGQVVAVVGESSTDLYYLDQELNIQAVGSVPETDNNSVSVYDNKISLHNYGKSFYKYDSDTESYTKTVVSDDNPWKAGLEPRVVNEEGQLVLGWFEPNPTTVEGLKSQIGSLQTSLDSLQLEIGSAAEGTGIYAELDKKADASDVYTKTEADAAIDTKVAAAVNAADHLKRKVFETEAARDAFIEENPDVADQYIYMVPSGFTSEANKYKEYIYIDGILEQVGNWEVDLDEYYTSTEVDELLADKLTADDLTPYVKNDNLTGNYYDKTAIDDSLNKKVDVADGKSLIDTDLITKLEGMNADGEKNYISSVDDGKFTVEEGKLSLKGLVIADVADLQTTLNEKLDTTDLANKIKELRDETEGLFSTNAQNKLEGIEEGAQKNLFNSVNDSEFEIISDELNIKAVAQEKVSGLADALAAKATKTELADQKTELNNSITEVSDKVKNIESLLNETYATKAELEDVSDRVGALETAITWTDLDAE